MSAKPRSERYHDLDFVRAAAMLLGILLHVCIFYMPPHKYFWGSGEYYGDPLDAEFLSFIHLFRMQLFYLMAGFFAELVIDRKGLSYLTRDRLKRIGIPFVVGVLVMVPIHVLLTNRGGYYTNTFDGMTLVERLQSICLFGLLDQNATSIQDGLIHFWFLFYLVIYYVIHFLFRSVFIQSRIAARCKLDCGIQFAMRYRWGFLLLGLVSFPFQYSLQSISFPPSGFNAPLVELAFYFFFYMFGIGFYRNRELLKNLSESAWFYALLAVPFILFISRPTEQVDESASVIRDITTWTIIDLHTGDFRLPSVWWEGIFHNGWDKVLVAGIRALLCWLMCFAFIGLAHRYLGNSRPVVRYLADSAYWIYWVHLPVTFTFALVGQSFEQLNSLTKCYLVTVLSSFLLFASYQWWIRYTWLGDLFMGKRKSKDDPGEASFSVRNMCLTTAQPVILAGLAIFLLGGVFDYNSRLKRTAILVEGYVARNRETLDRVQSIDGIVDKYGNTPLHAVARMPEKLRRYDPLPILLKKCFDPNVPNEFGRTALFTAVRTGNNGDIDKLIAAGADVNQVDRFGHAPSHVAAIKAGSRNKDLGDSYYQILKTLVRHGADLDLRDYKGRTVTDCLKQFAGREWRAASNSVAK